jgi:hypothetical protein
VYDSVADYSPTQGHRGWHHLDGNRAQLAYGPEAQCHGVSSCYSGDANYLISGPNWVHPGPALSVVRRWVAPVGGAATITGSFFDAQAGCGDGVEVRVYATGIQTADSTADFSAQQGANGWSYLDGQGTPLVYETHSDCPAGACYVGNESYLLVGDNWLHPGPISAAVKRWVAPASGSVVLSGWFGDDQVGCGDGVRLLVEHGGSVLYDHAIAEGDTAGASWQSFLDIQQGEAIDIEVHKGTGNSWCDRTAVEVDIELHGQTLLWSGTLADGQSAPIGFNLERAIQAGDVFEVEVLRGGSNNYCDRTDIHMTIAVD